LVRSHQAEATMGNNVMAGEAKLDLRGKELTREVAYKKTLMAEKLSRLLSRLLDMGGKDRPHHLVNKQPILSSTGRLDRGTGRSDHPCTWPPKDACSEAARDRKLEA
jgi:hypothetical protein